MGAGSSCRWAWIQKRLPGFCRQRTRNDRVSARCEGLGRDQHVGEIFCFRGRRGDLVKILWHDGVGMSLSLKRLEAGKFVWPSTGSGEAVQISAAQLGYLLEGMDWRNPR